MKHVRYIMIEIVIHRMKLLKIVKNTSTYQIPLETPDKIVVDNRLCFP